MQCLVWQIMEQELYLEMEYLTREPCFHMFEGETSQVALEFADPGEADFFRQQISGQSCSLIPYSTEHNIKSTKGSRNSKDRLRDRS